MLVWYMIILGQLESQNTQGGVPRGPLISIYLILNKCIFVKVILCWFAWKKLKWDSDVITPGTQFHRKLKNCKVFCLLLYLPRIRRHNHDCCKVWKNYQIFPLPLKSVFHLGKSRRYWVPCLSANETNSILIALHD